MIGFNLGSGQRRFTSTPEVEWVNIDCISRPPDQVPDVISDIRQLPYSDYYADYAVLHHVLEHFHLGEADGIIKEAHRVLKPGGSLIVCVPNLRELASARVEKRISEYIYMVNLYGAYQGEPGDDHHWGFWDVWELIDCLNSAIPYKWTTITPWKPREIPGASIAVDWWISIVECVK